MYISDRLMRDHIGQQKKAIFRRLEESKTSKLIEIKFDIIVNVAIWLSPSGCRKKSRLHQYPVNRGINTWSITICLIPMFFLFIRTRTTDAAPSVSTKLLSANRRHSCLVQGCASWDVNDTPDPWRLECENWCNHGSSAGSGKTVIILKRPSHTSTSF